VCFVLAVGFLFAACRGIGPEPTPSPAAPEPTPTLGPEALATAVAAVPTPTPNLSLDNAERTVFVYYAALGHQEYGIARMLLAPDLRARTSEADLAQSVAGTEAVGLAAIVPQSITPTRIYFQAIVSARTIPDVPSEWRFAANERYVVVVSTPEGWRISQVSTEPIQ
jgi:hypothetical protein